jgi:hypothetical protein
MRFHGALMYDLYHTIIASFLWRSQHDMAVDHTDDVKLAANVWSSGRRTCGPRDKMPSCGDSQGRDGEK